MVSIEITYTQEAITTNKIINIFITPKRFLMPLCNSSLLSHMPLLGLAFKQRLIQGYSSQGCLN